MSRCLPFPPPGYEKNGLSGEDLVEWIKREREKARREREKAKKERKRAKKRDKEEKSRECMGTGKRQRSHEKTLQNEMCKVHHDNADNPKRREDETDQSDKSDITEEHEQAQNDHIAYESSDNSRNNKKNKLQNLLCDVKHFCCGTDGLEVLPDKEHPSSHFETTDFTTHKKDEIIHRQEELSSTSGLTEIQYQEDSESAPEHSLFESNSMEQEVQFQELIKNWVPPLSQFEHTDFEDMGWLLR
ncbi:hypothetical protein IFM89_034072 [Coptis chinensis]|uniref:Uncharacterized protein n=1 Tax=Coptis chinensis TaxID=261450 RepID=A0A835MAV2_9MAGN|nr:hypothetical protein IFM89_034072 [Coptis chinensis]